MDSIESLHILKEEIPCRDNQIDILTKIFSEKKSYKWPALFIYGHTATGKTLVVKSVLKALELPFVFVNCIEVFSHRHLFESILTRILRNQTHKKEFRCLNMNDFVLSLKEMLENVEETLYIVLDKAERLRDMSNNILPAFLKLQELVARNVCVILISEIIWEKFRTSCAFCDPVTIYFPNYKRDDLLKILTLDQPSEYPKDFYDNYIHLILSVFEPICQDLNELKYLCSVNFKTYCKPIEDGEIDNSQVNKLWSHFTPHLKRSLQSIYLRDANSKQITINENSGPTYTNASAEMLELPFYSKFLLISAYLASYNPASSDKRFFLKNHGRMKKAVRRFKKLDKINHVLGPKLFSLDRLLAIFYSIVDETVTPSAFLFSQIQSLVSLHFLFQVETTDILQNPKYKCLVNLDCIRSISKTVDFDVVQYLYDFI